MSVAVLVALVVCAVAGYAAYEAADKEDSFYVVGAQPLDASVLDRPLDESVVRQGLEPAYGFTVHRLKPGQGMVLGYRFYSNGHVMAIDDEIYRKLSVWLPAVPSSWPATFDLADSGKAAVFYSRGGSAWPDNDCSARLSSGTVRVERRGDDYAVAVHGQLVPSVNSAARCKPESVDREFVAHALRLEQLTPWLGAKGTHVVDETYGP